MLFYHSKKSLNRSKKSLEFGLKCGIIESVKKAIELAERTE